MHEGFSLIRFLEQGDSVTHATALILLAMSLASWTVIVAKTVRLGRLRWSSFNAVRAFWGAATREDAVHVIRCKDRSGVFADVAADAVAASWAFESKAGGGIGAHVDASEFLGRSLQQSTVFAQARIERGLTMLASVGATAPFVGLLGTVWGIFNALISLSGANTVVLDQVAGPVGEALVMTAAGLFVAIPAVLAYNAFTRANRLVLMQLEGFANNLHAYLVSGVRLEARDGHQVQPVRASRAA